MSTPTVRRLMLIAAAAALTFSAAACADAPPVRGNVQSGTPAAGGIVVSAIDNEFVPEVVSSAAGEELTVTVTNDGDSPHNFVIEELDVSTGTIAPGDSVNATFTLPADGVAFVCTLHGGMDGRIEAA